MQFFGNQEKRSYIQRFFQHNQASNKPLFIMLIGPDGIGKASFVLEYIKQLLGNYFESDFLWMRDMSFVLGKPHSLQVETPSSLKTIPYETGIYQNRGVRELTSWLQQSSLSGQKIVLIENLERMTSAAMNAFLKTCEEPLPRRCLFATVSRESEVLPTLLSRALLVRFDLLSEEEMRAYLNASYPEIWGDRFWLLLKMSLWSPGKANFLYQQLLDHPETEQILLDAFKLFEQGSKASAYEQFLALKKISELQLLELFVDALLYSYSETQDQEALARWMEYKKFAGVAISQENLLWNAVLSV